jgi:signal transduction histidine kinase
VAIENARLYEDTRRREQWVAASGEISTALLSGRQAEDVLPLLATRAAELADATTALVALPHDGQDGLVVEVATGPDSSSLVGRRLGQLGSRGAAARRSPEPEAEAEPEVEAGSEVEVLAAADGPYEVCEGLVVGSAVVVPLGTADGGVLVVGSSTDAEPVRAGSVSALRTFAAQAALALELAARRRDAERLIVFEDRDRIARDLHDVVIQRLFATGMQLESTTRLLTAPEAKARVRQAVDNLDATIREIRSSIYALQTGPSSDAAPTLRSRLLEVLDAAAEQLGFSPTLQLTGLVDTGVPADIGEQVLAVLREALSNAARHANATRVVVQVDVGAKALRLAVRDNGVGIAETTRRSGLANLSGRAAALGGSFSVEPLGGPEGGTELIWSVPLET